MGIAAALFFNTTTPSECLDWRIRPSDAQYDAQKDRWNSLRDFLGEQLQESSGYAISSWLQGSYKFGTQIRPAKKDGEFDIDLGVYFRWKGAPSDGDWEPNELKDFVQRALEVYVDMDDTDAEGVSAPKTRCNRVHFADDFHIDVPSYHLDAAADARSLATQDGRWEPSDPKAIYAWWKARFDAATRSRARRMVRYLKMWAALDMPDGTPSSIMLTVLVADSFATFNELVLAGDDEYFSAVVAAIVERLLVSKKVPNPADKSENLNRLSSADSDALIEAFQNLQSICARALIAPTETQAAEIWAEAFQHFFPVPEADEDQVLLEKSRALVPTSFEPDVIVEARTGGLLKRGRNAILGVPKNSEIKFELANAFALPVGAIVSWTVRNAGAEAEGLNDLGHPAGEGRSAVEHSAYRGRHFMDVLVRLNGRVIGRRRIPVEITGLQLPPRNKPRPNWVKFRKKR